MAVEVFIPKMTDHMEYGEIVDWLVGEGQHVEEGQAILELVTDKAVVELEAPAAGIVKGIRTGCEPGISVPVGAIIAYIAEPEEDVPILAPLEPGTPTEAPRSERPAPPQDCPVPGPAAPERDRKGAILATPVARRIARVLGIELHLVEGSGSGGRIRESDVRAFARASSSPGRAVEWADLTPVQRRTGARMLESVRTAPQFALSIDVDATELLKARDISSGRGAGVGRDRLSITSLLVGAVAHALRAHPRANASLQDGRVRLHRQISIGVAIGGPAGLIVPVIQRADEKGLEEIDSELKELRKRTAAMRFSPEELSGGTFTISNLGMFGIDRFNAILNPPESAILAVGRVVKRPVGLDDGTLALRPMMSLTLTVDHRVLDGMQAAQFLDELRGLIEEPSTVTWEEDE